MKSNYRIPYDEALNPSQFEAVMFQDGPLLVIAGAGSGKTRTLTYRVARLVEDGLPPSALLLLTFTRKASMEMLTRASQLLDARCEGVSGGTFHSFANMVLRRYARRLGFDQGFSILDRPDTESILGNLRKSIFDADTKRYFPKKQTLANIFSRMVNKSLSIEEVIDQDYPHFFALIEQMQLLSAAYRDYKADHHLLDYDDLLIYLQALLQEHDDVRRRLSDHYQYIMVDEYQDTNRLQDTIVRQLCDRHRNVMVVGDDSQSIYAFRGAHIDNILHFPEQFSGTKIIRLEENYRSCQPILDLANRIIAQAESKYSKTLYSRKARGAMPTLVCTRHENGQSRFIVETILQTLRRGIPLRDIAVLFRAGFHAFDLEIELAKAGITYIKVGGFKFAESAHVKDLLSHLRVVANPFDPVGWQRVLLLVEHVGPKTAATVYHAVIQAGAEHPALARAALKPRVRKHLAPLIDLFSAIDPATMTLAQMGEQILAYYRPILEARYDDHPKRLRDLEQLLTIMERYHGAEEFLADMALEPPNTSLEGNRLIATSVPERLTLSTIHSAKGLEWHTVFVMSVLDGRFPSLQASQNEAELEEELRLLYVAVTRAKENLYLTYPLEAFDRASGMMLAGPSRFLNHLPEDILFQHFAEV
jgi:DNA helicase-2/ATP-dependent DNA helicase PcrA